MAELVGTSVDDGLAFLVLRNPPANALSQPLRAALMEALDAAEEDEAVREIVLIGAGGQFSVGPELTEYQKGLTPPSLRDLCERVDFCEKPVVAALSGPVFAGAFELALAAHYRVAHASARFSLPEMRLGLPPGGGGSQRLPRLAGAEVALDMLLNARSLPAAKDPGQGLVDALTDGDLLAACRQFCKRLRAEGRGPRRLGEATRRFADPVAYQKAVAAWRARTQDDPDSAPDRIVSLVEAAQLLPFEAGLAMEEDAFEACLVSESARALRHAYIAERLGRNKDFPPAADLPQLERIAILGGGPLAVQIVVSALHAGLRVQWGVKDPDRLADGAARVRNMFDKGVADGGLTREAADARLALLGTGSSETAVCGAQLIIQAAMGQWDIKTPQGAIRASALSGQVDALGLRFAPPVFATRLVEIIEGPDAGPEHTAMAAALADKMQKVPVLVRSRGESLAGRLIEALHRAADGLVDTGVSPYAIDDAITDWGWARPPFQTRDLVGLTELARAARGTGTTNWSAEMLRAGRGGRGDGAGFYDWSDEEPLPDQRVLAQMGTVRPHAEMAPETITMLLIGAMANEGARMLETRMAIRASDIDITGMLALDMPRSRGGPMKAVSLWGLFRVQRAMERLGHPDTDFWPVCDLWRDLVKNGRSFDAV